MRDSRCFTDAGGVRRILDPLRIPSVIATRPRPPPGDYLPGTDRTIYDPCVDPPAAHWATPVGLDATDHTWSATCLPASPTDTRSRAIRRPEERRARVLIPCDPRPCYRAR